MSKEDAGIFRRAAKLVADGVQEFSCAAVDDAVGPTDVHTSQRDKYCHLYSEEDFLRTTDFHPVPQTNETLPAARHHRVVALCFAAAMAEAGDL